MPIKSTVINVHPDSETAKVLNIVNEIFNALDLTDKIRNTREIKIQWEKI